MCVFVAVVQAGDDEEFSSFPLEELTSFSDVIMVLTCRNRWSMLSVLCVQSKGHPEVVISLPGETGGVELSVEGVAVIGEDNMAKGFSVK